MCIERLKLAVNYRTRQHDYGNKYTFHGQFTGASVILSLALSL